MIELGVRVRFAHPLVRSAVYRALDRERPPRRPPGARRRHRSRARSRSSSVAPCPRDGRTRRSGGRGDGALGRSCAGPGRAGRRGRVPAAGRGAHARSRPSGRALARGGAGEARRRRRAVGVEPAWPPPSSGRSTISSARSSSGCARRSCSSAGAGATRRSCCSKPRNGSNRSTPSWRATPTSRASRRPCSPGASAPAPVSVSWPRRRRASPRSQDPGAVDLLLDGLVVRFTDGYAAAVAPLSRALHAFRDLDGEGDDQHWLWLACRLAQDLWDDELWFALATTAVCASPATPARSRCCRTP